MAREDQKFVEAPAFGYSITANLGDDRQIVVQCFADGGDELGEIHGKIDKAMVVVDRQKAKYKKIELRKNADEMEKNLGRLKADLGEAESDFERRFTEAKATIETIQNEAHQGGRAQPVGANAQRVKALQSELEKLVEERKVARVHAATNIKRFEEEIAKTNSQIEECDALIAGG